jgi:hypothetical protein
MYVQLEVQLDVLFMYSLFLSISYLDIFRVLLHPSSGAPTVAYSHTFVMVLVCLLAGTPSHFYSLTVVKVQGCPSQYLLQWINTRKLLHTPMAVGYNWNS